MSFLPFYIYVATGETIQLADLGNRTYTAGVYNIGDEFQIEQIRHSLSLAEAIFQEKVYAVDSLNRIIDKQPTLNQTQLLLNRAGHTFSTDDLPEGVNNKYYDNTLVGNFIHIGPSSQNFLSFNQSTGELNVSALAITTTRVKTGYTSLADFVAAEYTTSANYQEGDVVILPDVPTGQEIYICTNLNTLTINDWKKIEGPQLSDTYIRNLFSASTPLTYNNTSGLFSLNIDNNTIKINPSNQLYTDLQSGNGIEIISGNNINVKLETNSGLNFNLSGELKINLSTTHISNFFPVIKLDSTGAVTLKADSRFFSYNNTHEYLQIKNNSIGAQQINWGLGSNQVSASDIPVDSYLWTYISNPTNIQDALEQLDSAISASQLIEGNGINITTGNVISVAIFNTGGLGYVIDSNGDTTLTIRVDNDTIEIDSLANYLKVRSAGISSTHINWGTGSGQVNASYIPLETYTWQSISTPTDVGDAIEKLDNRLYNKYTFHLGASSNNTNVNNRFIEREGNTPTNQSPYVIWKNCVLESISLSTNSASTWTAHVYRNGVSVATLNSNGNQYAYVNNLNISFSAGDRVSFYVQGTGVNKPSIDALFVTV